MYLVNLVSHILQGGLHHSLISVIVKQKTIAGTTPDFVPTYLLEGTESKCGMMESLYVASDDSK